MPGGEHRGHRLVSVVLTGRPGGTTHLAVEALATLPPEFRLIGGLAVLCRVGVPHRATVDLDALTRDLEGSTPPCSAWRCRRPAAGSTCMPGRLDLDVIDVSAGQRVASWLEALAGQGPLSDLELNVVAHTWAHDTAEPVVASPCVDDDGVALIRPRRPAGGQHGGPGGHEGHHRAAAGLVQAREAGQ